MRYEVNWYIFKKVFLQKKKIEQEKIKKSRRHPVDVIFFLPISFQLNIFARKTQNVTEC